MRKRTVLEMHRIKPIGMVAAVLLVGLLLLYVFANREQIKVSEDVLLEYGQAAYEEGAEGTGLVWNSWWIIRSMSRLRPILR